MDRPGIAWVAVGLIGFGSATAWADVITLRGGGEIKGVVVPDTQQPGRLMVQTDTAAKPLVFEKSQVIHISREPSLLDDYLLQKDKIEPTAQGYYDFGVWCEESKITGPAAGFFQKAIDADPQFGPAHKKLGHIQQGGRWVTYDQQREAQGLVKYKGKWISKAEKMKLEAKSAQLVAQVGWYNRLKVVRRKLFDKDATVRNQAEVQLNAVRDANAIPGLIHLFVYDGPSMRTKIGQIIGAITGPEATEALVALLLNEGDVDVRATFIEEVNRRKDPDAATKLMAALKSKDSVIIGHAALALASLRTMKAVPRMVESLIQSVDTATTVQVPTGGTGGGGGYGFAQNKSAGGVSNSYGHATGQGFSTIRSYAQIDSVVVSDNAVAFGVSGSQYPGGGNPSYSNNQGGSREVVVPVTVFYQNTDVLLSLETLTGMSFGYDQAAWRRWIETSFRPDASPARRVPQP